MIATITYSMVFDDDIFENEEKRELFDKSTKEEKEEFLKNQFVDYVENSSLNLWDLEVEIKEE